MEPLQQELATHNAGIGAFFGFALGIGFAASPWLSMNPILAGFLFAVLGAGVGAAYGLKQAKEDSY